MINFKHKNKPSNGPKPKMTILIEIINNDGMSSGNHDTRYHIWMRLMLKLQSMGHKILALYKKGVDKKNKVFESYDKFKHQNIIDFYIGHAVYNHSKERYNYFRFNKQIPVMTYEAGWLYNSLVVDRHKLFADSYYFNSIKQLIEKDFDEFKANEFRKTLLATGKSKWIQTPSEEIRHKDYIFIPGQVLHDLSIESYSKTPLIPFIEKVVNYARNKSLVVIYKPHPGMSLKEIRHGKLELEAFANKMTESYDKFYISKTSIFDLMSKSRFTACVNAGSMVDNMTTLTPVMCCGKSLFSNSGAVVFDENVERGLDTMYYKKYNDEELRIQQLKMLWWLNRTLMQEHLPDDENFKRFQFHSGVNFE